MYYESELTIHKDGTRTYLPFNFPFQYGEIELYDRINVEKSIKAIGLFNLLTKLRIGGIMYVRAKNNESYPIFRKICRLLTRCQIEFRDGYMIIRKAI